MALANSNTDQVWYLETHFMVMLTFETWKWDRFELCKLLQVQIKLEKPHYSIKCLRKLSWCITILDLSLEEVDATKLLYKCAT